MSETTQAGATLPSPQKRELPDGWRWVRLGEVCEFEYGSGLIESARQEGTVPVYGSNGIVGYHDVPMTLGPTIVIGRKGSVGQVHYSPDPCFPIDTTYYIDKAKQPVDLRWLAYILSLLGLPELNKASGVPGLNRNDAYKLLLPIPLLPEQRRIAEVLKQQMAAVEKARTAAQARLEAVKALPAAFLRQVFGGPASKSWDRLPFGQVAMLQRGHDLTERDRKAGAYPVVTSSGIVGTHSKFRAKGPGVVTGRSGSVGRVHYIDNDFWPHNTALYVKDFFGNNPRYVYFLLQWVNVKGVSSGTGVPTLDRKEVHKIIVSHPPSLEEQKQIAQALQDKLGIIEHAQQDVEAELNAINALPAALLRRAFNGEV